ncbi:hypothetical protein LTR36_007853 [Oleoguttula mirabilis]|uniref:Uncharacterized protein n=1 Tax=Oleoguttula mirabilis TaxID=1507867 RepID=A0AAV9J9H9_9PEZI|nr:hypothetical protein LTR36_007853 [Oleoguttula mirabilis]
MAKHRHLYTRAVLEKFVPSVTAEPVELDAGDDTEVRRMVFCELDGAKPKRASVHHEVHGDSPPTLLQQRDRKDSAHDLRGPPSGTEIGMGDYAVWHPTLPFTPPPAFPPKKRGFDPGELESAIEAAFG